MGSNMVFVHQWLVIYCLTALFGHANAAFDNGTHMEGDWLCNKQCSFDHYEYHFNWTYSSGRCWELIPKNDHEMFLDMDLWCSDPNWIWAGLNCKTMRAWSLELIKVLGVNCTGNPGLPGLVKEDCHWHCKANDRPVARCAWEFDVLRKFDVMGGIKQCHMLETCAQENGRAVVDVNVKCESNQVSSPHLDEILRLRSELDAATDPAEVLDIVRQLNDTQALLANEARDHADVRDDLLATRAAQAQTQELLDAALAELNKTYEQLKMRNAYIPDTSHLDLPLEGTHNYKIVASLVLTLSDPESALAAADFTGAVAEAIASQLEGVDASMIHVTSVAISTPSRRLSTQEQSLHTKQVVVEYSVVLEQPTGAGVILVSMQGMSPNSLASALSQELRSIGIALDPAEIQVRVGYAEFDVVLQQELEGKPLKVTPPPSELEDQLEKAEQDVQNSQTTLIAVVAAFSVVGGVAVCLGTGYHRYTVKQARQSVVMNVEAPAPDVDQGSLVVMGRPVADETFQPAEVVGGTAPKGATERAAGSSCPEPPKGHSQARGSDSTLEVPQSMETI
jgi:hypothetical protein